MKAEKVLAIAQAADVYYATARAVNESQFRDASFKLLRDPNEGDDEDLLKGSGLRKSAEEFERVLSDMGYDIIQSNTRESS